MSWNECLYHYHKTHGGSFLAGNADDGLLLLTYKDRPLTVDLYRVSGRYGSSDYVQARIPVTLGKPYQLTIGAERRLSGGLNTVLKTVPGLPDHSLLPADLGFPEVTKKRLIRSDDHGFTKLVLGSLDLRNALLACPAEKIEIRPGPGDEGLHLITVTTTSAVTSCSGGEWDLVDGDILYTQEQKDQLPRKIEEKFFPRLDRFLELVRAAYSALTQWPI